MPPTASAASQSGGRRTEPQRPASPATRKVVPRAPRHMSSGAPRPIPEGSHGPDPQQAGQGCQGKEMQQPAGSIAARVAPRHHERQRRRDDLRAEGQEVLECEGVREQRGALLHGQPDRQEDRQQPQGPDEPGQARDRPPPPPQRKQRGRLCRTPPKGQVTRDRTHSPQQDAPAREAAEHEEHKHGVGAVADDPVPLGQRHLAPRVRLSRRPDGGPKACPGDRKRQDQAGTQHDHCQRGRGRQRRHQPREAAARAFGLGPQVGEGPQAERDGRAGRFEAVQPCGQFGFHSIAQPIGPAAYRQFHRSSSSCQPARSSSARSRLSPVCSRDFTVPTGMPSSSDIASSWRSL